MTRFQSTLYWPRIIWSASKRFYKDNYTYQASALSFVTLLSIVPVLSVIVYFFTVFSGFSGLLDLTNQYIYANFLPQSTDIIQQYLQQLTLQAAHLPLISVLFFVVTAVMLVLTMEHALNQIWHTQEDRRKFSSRLFSWFILAFLPFIIGLISFLSGYIYFIVRYDALQYFVAIFLNLFINTIIFAILYTVVPNKRISTKSGLIGGVITAILFELAKKIFVFYIAYFTNYNVVYGSLAAIPVFLLWLYVSWGIFLFGALIMQARSQAKSTT